jgi:hypothetical protein
MAEYEYPKRDSMFAIKYLRWLCDSGAANEVGPDAFAVLAAVVTVEDELHYRRAPNFYNEQLQRRCGIVSIHALIRARTRAVNAGLLHYEPASKRNPGTYFACGFPAQSARKTQSIRNQSATLHTQYPIPNTPFDDWYEIYPRKAAKPAAEKAFVKAIKEIQKTDKVDADQAAQLLMSWTRERLSELNAREPQYRPQPATWLNETRYRDEIIYRDQGGTQFEFQPPKKPSIGASLL